jgi:hypothetical protein
VSLRVPVTNCAGSRAPLDEDLSVRGRSVRWLLPDALRSIRGLG